MTARDSARASTTAPNHSSNHLFRCLPRDLSTVATTLAHLLSHPLYPVAVCSPTQPTWRYLHSYQLYGHIDALQGRHPLCVGCSASAGTFTQRRSPHAVPVPYSDTRTLLQSAPQRQFDASPLLWCRCATSAASSYSASASAALVPTPASTCDGASYLTLYQRKRPTDAGVNLRECQ